MSVISLQCVQPLTTTTTTKKKERKKEKKWYICGLLDLQNNSTKFQVNLTKHEKFSEHCLTLL